MIHFGRQLTLWDLPALTTREIDKIANITLCDVRNRQGLRRSELGRDYDSLTEPAGPYPKGLDNPLPLVIGTSVSE